MEQNEAAQQPAEKPRRLSQLFRRGAPLLAAGVLGAGIAVGVGAAIGTGDGTTTIVQQVGSGAAAQVQPAAFAADGESLSVQEIYRRSGPGVVQITAVSNAGGVSPFGQQGGQRALGSGFVIDKAGHILTNFHVVQGAEQVSVNFSDQNSPVPATIVGVDPSTDLAVIKVDVPATALTPLPLGDSNQVQVGDPVVAIGNPFGLDRTVTAGIVSALQRHITAPNGFAIDHVIQTDAAINHGNSGGPLLDARGEVIGVNSQIQSGGVDGNVGIGFAVPVDTVKEVASQLIETGKVEHAFLGIEMQTITPEAARDFRLPTDQGILIATVRPGSPAEKAGLRGGSTTAILGGETWLLGGDVITRADGQAVTGAGQLRDIVLSRKPGDTLTLEVHRDGKTLTVSVELGRRPATPTG